MSTAASMSWACRRRRICDLDPQDGRHCPSYTNTPTRPVARYPDAGSPSSPVTRSRRRVRCGRSAPRPSGPWSRSCGMGCSVRPPGAYAEPRPIRRRQSCPRWTNRRNSLRAMTCLRTLGICSAIPRERRMERVTGAIVPFQAGSGRRTSHYKSYNY